MTMTNDIPTSAAELTPAWLTGLLRSAGHDVVVDGVEATPVGSGQMAGSYRLALRYRGATDLPARMVAKLATGNADQRRFGSGAFRNEVLFYRTLAATVRVPLARCHAAVASDSGSEFVLLLDDLAPAVQGDQIAGCGVAQARAVAVAAAGLHGPRWCDPTLLAEPGMALPTAADRELMDSVLAPMTDAFRDRFADRLSRAESATLDWLVDTAGDWLVAPVRHFALLHGDLRVDNVMFGPDGSVTIIDWQTITPGQPLRDIAFLLATSLPTPDRRAHERAIVADYHAALTRHGVTDYPFDDCWRDYAAALVQAPLIIVFGCAAAQPTPRGDHMFHTMLTRTAATITDLLPNTLR
ncbi:phosphotransferase family protein [Nocardia blacklockiae]|uniref:phosphotransferase family protein n=1 Tax=Nocardia blacklockiae TaxID=480036 RepID=UPI0018954351|nr:phosphotransferase [Nocardia blacklockiae]MBF6171894.1 phosphotransferase [Nocardia blacklockiae]